MSRTALESLDVHGKAVFLRVDFNVPMDGGSISDDRRIRAALPTIEWLSAHGARVVLASHFGRPKGKPVAEFSLRPCADRLQKLMGRPVGFVEECVGPQVEKAIADLAPGSVALLENLRFHKGEEAGDPAFAAQLARGIDLYVNDAFGAAHRAHASVSLLPGLLKGGAPGFLMEKEIASLSRLLTAPERPYIAILGGAKVSDKIQLIERLLERVDSIMVGGAMAYTFLSARAVPTGGSLVERDKLDLARELELKAAARKVPILLPLDHVTAAGLDGRTPRQLGVTSDVAIEEGRIGLDIGPRTLSDWKARLDASVRTVLWNGPVGFFEAPGCDAGTRGLADHLAQLRSAFRVLGGGDTAAAAAQFGLEQQFDHVSTGGGAALEMLSGDELPGVVALER